MNNLRCIAVSALLLACTTDPTPTNETAKQPKIESDQKAPVPVTTANPPQDPPPPEPKMAPVDGYFMAEGAPPPRGCTAKADCLGDTVPDLDQPCCQNPYRLEPYAQAYKMWVYQWRRKNCSSVECPPPPVPTQPPPCHFEVDCVQGQCVDACK